ncbi:MAG: VRR-NUC domain-containing protein [Coriobacteriia bacterium]|nr:VRR-NUC domain-containing protein [Coriobacteriia bacterium]
MVNVKATKKSDPKQRVSPNYKEAYEQQLFCRWLDKHNVTYFAIPNQLMRPSKNAPYIGVKRGVPDLFICEPQARRVMDFGLDAIKHAIRINNSSNMSKRYEKLQKQGFAGIFIEMKRCNKSKSIVSEDQKKWIKKLNTKGYEAYICYGASAAIECVKEYMGWLNDCEYCKNYKENK